jgi:hypothetical protein
LQIGTRLAPKKLMPPDFQPAPLPPLKCRSKTISLTQVAHQKLLEGIVQSCRDEWGVYPEPVAVWNDNGEWIINFRNHANDRNPSTFVKGSYRRLILNGAHTFTRDFFLPDHLSANELCEELLGTATPIRLPPSLSSAMAIRGKTGAISK